MSDLKKYSVEWTIDMIGFQGDEPGKVQKAIAKIKEIIQQGIDVSFSQILNTLWKTFPTISFAVARGLEPAEADAVEGARHAERHSPRGRRGK